MANSFWNFVSQFVAGTLAKAEDVNTNFSGVASGLDAVETEINNAIQVTNAAGTTDIVLNAAARANKLVAFDANGDIAASQILGDWKGNHADAAGTDYQIRDVVKDAAGRIQLGSLYICNTTHTSTGTILTDTANWDLLVDATDLTTLGGFTAAQYLRSDADDTYTGTLTLVGSIADFTSTGIDDNATGERVQVDDTELTLGVSGSLYAIAHAADTNSLAISGGNAATTGGNAVFYGSTHATLAGDVGLRSGSNTFLNWDESAGTMVLSSGSGAKTAALSIDASQNVTFAGGVIGSAGNEIDSGLFAKKASDTSRASTETLADDPDLSITLAASTVYRVELGLYIEADGSTPDFKWVLVEPDGSFYGTAVGNENAGTFISLQIDSSDVTHTVINCTGGAISMAKCEICAFTGGSGGAFKLQWAQNLSSGQNTTLKAGSWIKATKLV